MIVKSPIYMSHEEANPPFRPGKEVIYMVSVDIDDFLCYDERRERIHRRGAGD